MSAWDFPKSLFINGKEYAIRTDYRAVLDVLTALNDPELKDEDEAITSYMQSQVILEIMFPEYESIPEDDIEEALRKVSEFIDMGLGGDSKKPKTMDWEKDAPILIPSINKVLGCEVRAVEYMHWWTFLGAYMEIGEGLFSSIVSIRQKKAQGKKLEKYELEFYRDNKALIDFDVEKRSNEEAEMLRNYFGYKK